MKCGTARLENRETWGNGQEESVWQWNCPTHAKTGLEWATDHDDPLHRLRFPIDAKPHLPQECERWGSALVANFYWMVTVRAFDSPPPGVGFFMTRAAVPGAARAFLGT